MDIGINFRAPRGSVYYIDPAPTPEMLLNNAIARYGFGPDTPSRVVADRLEDDGRSAAAGDVRSPWAGDA